MSEVRLVIREAECDWSGTIHGSMADLAIAALSADPATLAELEAACARYAKPTPKSSFFANLSPGLDAEPYDAGLVVIDLAARLVAVDSTYSSPGPVGEIMYHDGHRAMDTWLRYHLAEDWLFTNDGFNWRGASEQRRSERAARRALDARQVFYGRPLLEYITRETFAAAECGEGDAAGEDTIREIHAAWLLTPRGDLDGDCPREVALARQDQLSWDLQDQSERWSLLGQCPPV